MADEVVHGTPYCTRARITRNVALGRDSEQYTCLVRRAGVPACTRIGIHPSTVDLLNGRDREIRSNVIDTHVFPMSPSSRTLLCASDRVYVRIHYHTRCDSRQRSCEIQTTRFDGKRKKNFITMYDLRRKKNDDRIYLTYIMFF